MLYRARLLFLLAVVAAVVVVATEFPIGQLVHARSAAAAAAAELAQVRHENRSLQGQVADLKQGSTIEQIAHQDYGLVLPGQRSYVVMPSDSAAKGSGEASPLATETIPHSDLVPSDSALSPPGGTSQSQGAGASFWHRLVGRLEFWKASA